MYLQKRSFEFIRDLWRFEQITSPKMTKTANQLIQNIKNVRKYFITFYSTGLKPLAEKLHL